MSADGGQSLAANHTQFHPITGQFRDEDLESAFRTSVLPRVQQNSRLALIGAAILVGLFGVSDYLFLGLSRPFYLLLGMRVVVISGCLFLGRLLHSSTALLTRPWLYSAAPILIATGTILIIPLRPHTVSTQLTAVGMVVTAFYLVIPNVTWGMLASSLYMTVGFLLGAWYWAAMPAVGVITSSILLIVANVVGCVVAVRRARMQREQFVLLQEEQRSKQRLMEEVARREALEKRLRTIAQTDELTGLSTRRHFMESAQAAFVAARHQEHPFSLCMIDIDNFKMINDRWGHDSGDRVLREVADACRQTLRGGEPIGRFGGEEFVAALPAANLSDARRIAERLRERVADLQFDGDLAALRVTMTIGLSEVHPQEAELEPALKRADAALYQGKRSGRDIVLGDDLDGYVPGGDERPGSRGA